MIPPGIGRARVRVACACAVIAMSSSPAAGLPVHSWVSQSTSMGRSNAQGNSASSFPDGRTAVVGQFVAASVDLGAGANRTSGQGGFAASAVNQVFGVGGTVASLGVAGVNATTGAMVPTGVAARGDGTVVSGGYFFGTAVDFSDAVVRTSANSGNSNSRSSFVTARAADGSVIWLTTSTSAGSSEAYVRSVAAHADGSPMVAGDFLGTNVDLGDGVLRTSGNSGGARSMFVQRLGPGNGSVAWTLTSTSTGADLVSARGISAAPDGGAVVTGDFRGTDVDLGDGVLRTSAQGGASFSSFTLKLSGGGAVEWVTTSTAAGSSSVMPQGVAALADGRAAITGYFQGVNVDFGGGITRTSTSIGSDSSLFIVGMDADGTPQWISTPVAPTGSTSVGMAVASRADGRAVATGRFDGTAVDFGDGVPRTSGDNGNERSLVTLEVMPDGTVSWVSTSTGGTLASAYGLGVSALDDGSTVVTGKFTGANVDLGDGILRTSSENGSVLGSSIFTMGLVSTPGAPAAPVATAEVESARVSVAPLPGGSVTSYSVRATAGGGSCTIEVPATSCVVTGLAAGVPRQFTATAANVAGTSPASAASNMVIPQGAPIPAPLSPVAALAPRLLPQRTRLVSGQRMRIGIRVANTGAAVAGGVTSCIRLPSNMAIVRGGSALRSGRTVCFRLGDIAAGSQATRIITVRGAAVRTVRRSITGTARERGEARVSAPAKGVIIRPRASRARVTG